MNNRINQLLAFLEEDPNDAFTIYALAMEYTKTDIEKALFYYEQLIKNHTNYTGTYYHLAQLYADLGEVKEAQKIYKEGIEVCKQENDKHALQELEKTYQSFLIEEGLE